MTSTTEQNKAIVLRFNKECIEQGKQESFDSLLAADCINHLAPAGSNGPESMVHFLKQVLRNGFPDIKVEILDQIAEGDRVTTRKKLHGTHTGEFMGIPATNKKVVIDVIDIVKLRDGKYTDHWACSSLHEVIAMLGAK